MDAVTYPDGKVVEAMGENMIPVRVPFDAEPLSRDFNVRWTPTMIVVDDEKTLHHRTTGFLHPEEMVPTLLLGRGKMHFGREELEEAERIFNGLIRDHSGSLAAPEAVYYHGVSRYKQTHKADPLKKAYEDLQKGWSGSEWAVKSAPYRLL
jgi:hypothetical protein